MVLKMSILQQQKQYPYLGTCHKYDYLFINSFSFIYFETGVHYVV
jgi:hypothetical protein